MKLHETLSDSADIENFQFRHFCELGFHNSNGSDQFKIFIILAWYLRELKMQKHVIVYP